MTNTELLTVEEGIARANADDIAFEAEQRAKLGGVFLDATAPPCPSWCRLLVGHAYTEDREDGSQSRGHESKLFGYSAQACITVGNYEIRHADGSLSYTVLTVDVGDLDPSGYMRTEAVELARAVLDAAVFIDESTLEAEAAVTK